MNYKENINDVINVAGYQRVMRSTDKFIVLLSPDSTATDETQHDATTDSNYQVPTGKKLRIFHFVIWVNFNATTRFLHYADDVDGELNEVRILTGSSKIDQVIDGLTIILTDVPAGKYINATKATSGDDIIMYAIEMNA